MTLITDFVKAAPEVKMMVLLGEVGGTEEYKVCEAIKNGTLTKPLVGWCIGTCADMFATDVQFGHAGNTLQYFSRPSKIDT